MITVAIAAILLALAAPSFQSAMVTSRTATLSNDLLAALQLARSEAIKRRTVVTLCPRVAGAETCASGTNYASGGWAIATGGTVLRVWDTVTSSAVTGPADGLDFDSLGRAENATFSVAVTGATDAQKRCIRVIATGRASQHEGTCS